MGELAASQITEASYRAVLGDDQGAEGILFTHAGNNRGFGADHDPARDNILAAFQGFGLETELHPFTYQSYTYYNVVGTMTGTVYPDEILIVGAHFDSVDNPGADDNASGTAAVLEIARVLSQYDSDRTIRFIAFDREEQGLYGSDAYATEHAADNILGMLSLDMIAWYSGTELADIYGRAASSWVKGAVASAVTTYGEGITTVDRGQYDASDHAPFEWQGFQACLLIEDWGNPYYHTPQDNVDMAGYIDYDYARRMTRSAAGFLVDNAGVQVITADGDYEGDGDVDMDDYIWFQTCFSGEGNAYPPAIGCDDFDFDGDDDVDLTDYEEFYPLLAGPFFLDCNGNGLPDADDIRLGISNDCNENIIPDECEPDCDADGLPDECALDGGSADCNEDAIPDECQLEGNDCNENSVPDECEPPDVMMFDDLETASGWTVGAAGDDATTGIWERVDPVGTSAQPEDDHTDAPGTMCYVTGQHSPGEGAGYNDIDGGRTSLITPAIDATGITYPAIAYWRWYSNSAGATPLTDIFEVDVSNDDGVTWVPVETVGPGGSEVSGGWIYHEFRVADFVTPTALVRLKFVASDEGEGSLVEAAIDDLALLSLECGE